MAIVMGVVGARSVLRHASEEVLVGGEDGMDTYVHGRRELLVFSPSFLKSARKLKRGCGL